MAKLANDLGTEKISSLLIKQAVPATIGILVMSLNMIVDTIFVGQWVGVLAIAAITVVLPIAFLISSIGMGIGIGGSSIISRALGAENSSKAFLTFGNQICLTLILAIIFVLLGNFYSVPILNLFGAKGDILPIASEYFAMVIFGVPFLAFAMMGNPVIRAEGKPKFAMYAMIIPAILNIVLDVVFIKFFDWGMTGAGLATSISYASIGLYILYFFLSSKSELKIIPKNFALDGKIVREIVELGGVSVVRQGAISVLMIVLNYSLFTYGGEISISIFGIINRVMMFSLSPVMGVSQGFLPVAGFNIGAKKNDRVKETIKKSIYFGSILGTFIFLAIILFKEQVIQIFTDDITLLNETPNAMLIVFIATPIITMQLIGSAYFQAAGKAMPALLLTLLKQGIFLIPLAYILPKYYGVLGVWWSFPIADILSTIVTVLVLKREIDKNLISA
ncbi:MATE family efflux transporter [Polaribacter reichenbachii]|uniref:Multidrug export protein MepA n=1 Tax=Polaribacter reichenbachii TaxID=996801 RepID=A0A1B8U591_9FLAO|nr:MATE family efflux transporter [Polaribacter reichenbachii]APZ47622.1 MATE family efflux transporter [Polaribacter reichenbachii]AUC18262.1 MATE family efflux transporter [Polaribacter reichenbachii]OBY67025.1 MATE family efflux transporter [Polaribacter reichenbachii]